MIGLPLSDAFWSFFAPNATRTDRIKADVHPVFVDNERAGAFTCQTGKRPLSEPII